MSSFCFNGNDNARPYGVSRLHCRNFKKRFAESSMLQHFFQLCTFNTENISRKAFSIMISDKLKKFNLAMNYFENIERLCSAVSSQFSLRRKKAHFALSIVTLERRKYWKNSIRFPILSCAMLEN